MDRRIIAIAVAPKAYDEILKLKGDETWTSFVLHAVVKLVGGNEILEKEIDALPKKAEPKPKVEKPKVEKKTKKEKKAKTEKTGDTPAPGDPPEAEEPGGDASTEAETAAITEALPDESEGN